MTYYSHGSVPAFDSPGSSADIRSEFDKVQDGFVAVKADIDLANANISAMNTSNGVLAFTYAFDVTTTDADPGSGKIRLGNAAQNTATVVRMDLLDALGTDCTAVIDTFDASTSVVKGQLRLSKVHDGSKWLTFNLTSRASPSGYRNLTVACTGYSSASPFADGDQVVVAFTRTGDKGDVGPGSSGDNVVIVTTGNGHGAVSARTRRFTTTLKNVGTDITYADDANAGGSFTINATGLYAIYYQDQGTNANKRGVTLNDNTNGDVDGTTAANLLGWIDGDATKTRSMSLTTKLTAGDVIRARDDGNCDATTAKYTTFAITKVGSI